jgi:two-component system response regulator AtoC
MMRINCASLSDSLLESELFGHERGAFTGAVQTKVGLLEAASGGTVLLDEVGELPLTTQAKLLRALETHELLRVGGIHPRAFDVRFIAASNRDLRAMCDRQAFRSDLFFRLNGITIAIPPLRERAGEVRALAAELIARQCAATARTPPMLTPQALAHLQRHEWPGNVRELRNVIERALVLCPGPVIGPEHLAFDAPASAGSETARLSTLPPPAHSPAPLPPEDAQPQSLKEHIGVLERQRIVEALAQCGGNQTKAARVLGISRRTLLTRLDAWGLPRPRK